VNQKFPERDTSPPLHQKIRQQNQNRLNGDSDDRPMDKKSRNDRRWIETADLSSWNTSPLTDSDDTALFTTKSSKKRSE
jgi:hypothetical protein